LGYLNYFSIAGITTGKENIVENIAALLKEIIHNDIVGQVIAGIILMSLPVLIKKIKESARNLHSVLRDPARITVCFFLSLGVFTLFVVFPNMRNKEEAKPIGGIVEVAPPHDFLPDIGDISIIGDASLSDAVDSMPVAPASQETIPVLIAPALTPAPQREQITVRLFGTEQAFSGDITIHIDSIIDKPMNTGTSTQLREYAVTGWISINDLLNDLSDSSSNDTKKEIPDFRAGDSVKLGNFTIQMTKVPDNEHAEFSIQKYR
jgi:hypothetical protein